MFMYLTGGELIAKKFCHLVSMGFRFLYRKQAQNLVFLCFRLEKVSNTKMLCFLVVKVSKKFLRSVFFANLICYPQVIQGYNIIFCFFKCFEKSKLKVINCLFFELS